MSQFDVVVIGAGPGGLAAALQLARQRRSVLLLDSNRPRHAATLLSHGFLTRDGTPPLDLRAIGREEVLSYPTASYERTEVQAVERDGDDFVVRHVARGKDPVEVETHAVVVATGLREILPAAEHTRAWYGTSLHSCMDCDGYDKRDLPLAVIGEQPDLLKRLKVVRRFSHDLEVFTNGSERALTDADREELAGLGIPVFDAPIVAIEGDETGMRTVVLEDGTRRERTHGFVRPEWHPNTQFLQGLGVTEDERGQLVVDEHQRSSLPGLYAAGDITPGYRQLMVAAGEGTIAGSICNRDLLARGL